MAENSKIEWTDHTANFWWGCLKVSPGCEHCYAEGLSARYGKKIWGPASTTQRERKLAIWKDIFKWDKQAQSDGVRRRVFVQSMSDFLEDHPQANEIRKDAIKVLESLKWLDVLMLTKRPENAQWFLGPWFTGWPEHVWMGTSVENQKYADQRIPHLLEIPAKIRFLSCEPLLGPVKVFGFNSPTWGRLGHHIDWVIAGGESGPRARPMHPDWAISLRDQCAAASVPFFFKQWGEYLPGSTDIEGTHKTWEPDLEHCALGQAPDYERVTVAFEHGNPITIDKSRYRK